MIKKRWYVILASILVLVLFSQLAVAFWVKDFCDVEFKGKQVPYNQLNEDMKILVKDKRVKFLFDHYPLTTVWKICETKEVLFLKSVDVNPGVICLMGKDNREIVCQEKK
ncbi:MAG TPA: hypothetical protein DCL21_01405 [Alphaproteobacteria bacterium]|nr:hypothetical protein [Alphaproteobacteria bacterium]